MFAAEAITIDNASGGRLELAYGAAWFEEEHRKLGIPFPPTKERVDAFEEAVQVVHGLLTTDGFTFEGAHFQVHDATLLPRCVQQPHAPLWIGAHGEKRMMPIAAKWADVWHSYGPPEDLGEKSKRLSEMAERAGRDPSEIMRATSLSLDDLDQAALDIEKWEEAGFGYLICGWPGAGRAQIQQFAETILRG